MIREICRDVILLSRKALPTTEEDLPLVQDLLDTLTAHAEECVGMAANMIGENKSIIVFSDNGKNCLMLNPVILKKDGAYKTEEGCLSLPGKRPCIRYQSIKVQYQNEKLQSRIKSFSGFTAEIIQHEIDHLNGILI